MCRLSPSFPNSHNSTSGNKSSRPTSRVTPFCSWSPPPLARTPDVMIDYVHNYGDPTLPCSRVSRPRHVRLSLASRQHAQFQRTHQRRRLSASHHLPLPHRRTGADWCNYSTHHACKFYFYVEFCAYVALPTLSSHVLSETSESAFTELLGRMTRAL